MGLTLPKLQTFSAGINRFTGPLPPSITNASDLVYIGISYNSITGPIPMNFGSLPNLRQLNLGVNKLGENQPPDELSFFDSLVNCTNLQSLVINENSLRGELPNSIVNLSTTIEILDLSENHIRGDIPCEIGRLVNMEVLAFRDNLLTGAIPESVGDLSKLVNLHLGKNFISGVIQPSFINMTRLVILILEFNMLEGSIPPGLFNISTLEILVLTNNGLGGVIPEHTFGLFSHCIYLYLSVNRFTGPLPSNIGNFKQLVELDVSSNRLKGDIPATLGKCVMLEELHMEGNLFQGRIPSSFKVLRGLQVLDLSCNNLSGNIPRFFDAFIFLEFLDLSNNKLGGEVPKNGLFSNFSAFSVYGNLRLCGGIQALQLPACCAYISTNKKKTFALKVILLVVLLPLAILLACLALIFNQHKKSKEMDVLVSLLQDNLYPLPRFSYQDLLLATNEFSSNNLLGEGRYGSVYKGVLQSVEQTVAVKVINVEVRGANKSFLAECGTLRDVRHRNLIKIVTACSSTDFKGNNFKALVFELMPNGSLDNWLHQCPSYQGNERNLTLLQRLNISIDIAVGVDYLHHHSHASIIHCDIKPSNILLDEEFVARIGDFGLARFSSATTSGVNQGQMSSVGVCGTVGYVPPEYGMGGKISTQGDVYSYGILLLEMFSGIQPTSSSFMDSANNLHDYVRKALQQRVLDITDPRIVQDREYRDLSVNPSYSRAMMEVCLKSVFEVGLLCSVEPPRERIDISVAVKQLKVARDRLLQCRQGQ